MILTPTQCIKCGVSIVSGRGASHLYRQWRLKRKGGGIHLLGSCNQCEITDDDLEEVLKVHKDYYKAQGIEFAEEFESVEGYDDWKELRKMSQGGKCIVCQSDLGENYVMSNGMAFHEGCSLSQ